MFVETRERSERVKMFVKINLNRIGIEIVFYKDQCGFEPQT